MTTASSRRYHCTLLKRIAKTEDTGEGKTYNFTPASHPWAEFLKPRIMPSPIIGDGRAVVITQGIKIKATDCAKEWRIVNGSSTYRILDIDSRTTPGELILTTMEVKQ